MALALAPDLTRNRSPSRAYKARQRGSPDLDPETMPPMLLRCLTLLCHGYTNVEIAERTHYSFDSVRDQTKALLGIFDASNRAHLAALAVAQGYVDMKLAVGE